MPQAPVRMGGRMRRRHATRLAAIAIAIAPRSPQETRQQASYAESSSIAGPDRSKMPRCSLLMDGGREACAGATSRVAHLGLRHVESRGQCVLDALQGGRASPDPADQAAQAKLIEFPNIRFIQ